MPCYIITDLGTVRYAGASFILRTSYEANVASERLDYHNILDRMRGRQLGYSMRELIELETAVRDYERAQTITDELNTREIERYKRASSEETE